MNPIRKTQALDLTKVRINDRFWKPRLETNRKVTLPTEYRICKKTGRIDGYRLRPNAPSLTRTQLWMGDVAKWIEAAAYSLAIHPDTRLNQQVEDAIDRIVQGQKKNGYLHCRPLAPGKRWTDLRSGHELYDAGHLMEAAVAYYQATGKRKFLDAMCRNADLLAQVFGPGKGQKHGYCGHPEVELALVKLYRATGKRLYLELAKFFINERGRRPHYYEIEARARGEDIKKYYNDWKRWEHEVYEELQAHRPVIKQDKAVGHAVRALYLYSGMADVAAETGDPALLKACRRLWRSVTRQRMYVTGGVGSSNMGERFTCDYDLPNETAYAETCANIALVFFAHRMLQIKTDSEYADVMERALYNGVLSGISLNGQRFFYENPLGVYPPLRIHTRQKWFGCACCPPNIARLLASFGKYLYSFNDHEVYVHLYVQSRAEITIAGESLALVQKTDYPWDGKIKIIIQPPANNSASANKKINFTLALRIPAWCRNYSLRVNGKVMKIPASSCGYVKLAGNWQWGDEIELALSMPVEEVEAHPSVRHNCGRVALQRGPLVYCLEETDNGPDLNDIALVKNPQLKVRFDRRLLGGIPVITGQAVRHSRKTWKDRLYRSGQSVYEKTTVKAVPYCLWNNRGEGEMLVWIRKEH